MKKIRIGIVGVGNCASSLVQGIHYYKGKNSENAVGLMHWKIGDYRPFDIQVTAAFDIDKRKVGLDVSKAIFSLPNCTTVFCNDIEPSYTIVNMGPPLDGVSDHMGRYERSMTYVVSDQVPLNRRQVVDVLKQNQVEVLLNYLPVGSELATHFYAECALEAKCAFVNNIPVFIASNRKWSDRFSSLGLPLMGDDIKSQLGATITHRTLVDLFRKRGVKLERTYQLNTGGNTDFLNMLNRHRLESKKISKTEAVQSVTADRLDEANIHVGPSDYVAWQKDNKVSFIRMEGKLFGDIPMNLELRLSVEDSPNSAGVSIDAIRCAKLALDRGLGGVIKEPSCYLYKHPPFQCDDNEAFNMMEIFIKNTQARV